jgi:hypothetical protein
MQTDTTKNNFAANGGHESALRDNVIFDSFPQSIKSVIATLRVVIDQIDSDFNQARELILEITKRLDEGSLCKRNHISITVKEILKDKIKENKVSEKWIEECLPPEYKRQYIKSELSSLSKERPKQQLIEVSTEGKPIVPEQHDECIGWPTEIQPSKRDCPDRLASEFAFEENDDTVTADLVLTINGEYACLMPPLSDSDFESLHFFILSSSLRRAYATLSLQDKR